MVVVSSSGRYNLFEIGPNMAVEKRRLSCPQTVQHIWDAVEFIRQQKQISNFERISNYMRRKHNLNESDLERQLNYAVRDNLISVKKSMGCKGSKVGIEQEAYRLPEEKMSKDGHDWYCFECHRGGDVLLCTTCHRVYHAVCVKEDLSNADKFLCTICRMLKAKNTFKMKKEDMDTLLGYTCLRLKEKTKDLHRMPHNEEDVWKQDFLIYQKMDLITMEDKAKACEYKRLEEFQADAQNIVHNVVIYYGIHSPMADMARQMLRDCIYDLNEIKQCKDCYRMSNEKADKFWFCQPCDPPHDLVFAKQKGFPFWPAKVIGIIDGIYDVRFFGGYHQRANVEKVHIKPITTSLQQLSSKRTTALNRALDELRRHQQLLDQQKRDGKHKRSRPTSSSSSRSRSRSRSNSRSRRSSGSDKEDSDSDDQKDDSETEAPSSSSPKVARIKDESASEDHNVVSSSCQESPSCKVSIATQTNKKLLIGIEKKGKGEEAPVKCNCEAKYHKAFREFKDRLEAEHKEDKEKALKELREELLQEFEAEKQKEITVTLDRLHREAEQARKRAEEQLRLQHQQEMDHLIERHRTEISETKRKQWCYNCEAEAIYHCCWNTSYCSVECQQIHWHKEHKRTCRRKR